MTQDPAWIVWLSNTVGILFAVMLWFFYLELPGLKPDKGPLTLSWTIRRWLGIRPHANRRYLLVPLFVALCSAWIGGGVWFLLHILFQ